MTRKITWCVSAPKRKKAKGEEMKDSKAIKELQKAGMNEIVRQAEERGRELQKAEDLEKIEDWWLRMSLGGKKQAIIYQINIKELKAQLEETGK